jgi:hypothetical protein
VGAVLVAASASLGTLVLVQASAPPGTNLISGLVASVQQPTPTPTDSGKGKGKGDPSPTPTDGGKGKGKGDPSPTPVPPAAAPDIAATKPAGDQKAPTPTPTPTPTAKGTTTTPYVETTLPAAQQFAGFRVRTLAGLPGAELTRVRTATDTFDGAPGRPSSPEVELTYSLGSARIVIVELRDPFDVPASVRASAEAVEIGDSVYAVVPGTGPVHFAETREADGVFILADFFAPGGAGVERPTAHQVVGQLG